MTRSGDLVPARARAPAPAFAGAAGPAARGVRRAMGIGRTVAFGVAAVALFFGGFAAWSALAPLETAAIAPGALSVSGKRKTVQHLEGGIVADIRIAEGDRVEAGETLVVLDDTQTRATVSDLEAKHRSEAALKARLEAERDGLAEVRYPQWLREAAASHGGGLLATQDRIFAARARTLANRASIHDQRIAQLREEIVGLTEEGAAQERELDLLAEDRDAVRSLVETGAATRTRLRAFEREIAELTGRRARNRAFVARAEQRIGETRLMIAELGNAHRNEVVAELREVDERLSELAERLRAARDVLARTRIAAPVAGTVVDLRIFTRGGVIGRGQPLMDIVPAGGTLVIEAHVNPTDIDSVWPELPAQVRLTAFSQLTTPTLAGTVLRVSADRLVNEQTGAPYYLAEVALDPEQPALAELSLQPGMPAEVMIVTGKTTAIDYLLKPIVASLGRALREE